jgi:DinB superfamily
MLPKSTLLRLETQLDVVPFLLRQATPKSLMARTTSGEWSAHENLAHLARHHAILLERLRRIVAEDAPELARYRAEEDPSWREWSSLPTDEVVTRLNTLRTEVVQFIKGLSDAEADRVGIHPVLGIMDITQWIEFFLLHEAHHLYKVMIRLAAGNSLITH